MANYQKCSKMMMMIVFNIVLISVFNWRCVETSATGSSWNYVADDSQGPEKWRLQYPDCGGVMQSPVNIETRRCVYDRNLQPFDISDYSITDGVSMKLENVGGHTAEVVLSGKNLYLKRGNMPDKYKLEQFHFHWGYNASRGSEHSVDGVFFPMEVHLVHRQNRFPTVAAASAAPSGLAVLSFLFKIGRNNAKYNQLIDNLSNIPNPNDEVEIPTIRISDLLPANFDYYRYQGSLTTPPCYESVIWSVAMQHIEISDAQLNAFRALINEEHHPLVDDFRPIQPLNQRTILTSKRPCHL